MEDHMVKVHKLYKKNYFLAIFIFIGTNIGIVSSLLFKNSVYTPIGLLFGLGIGSFIDDRLMKKKRVI